MLEASIIKARLCFLKIQMLGLAFWTHTFQSAVGTSKQPRDLCSVAVAGSHDYKVRVPGGLLPGLQGWSTSTHMVNQPGVRQQDSLSHPYGLFKGFPFSHIHYNTIWLQSGEWKGLSQALYQVWKP